LLHLLQVVKYPLEEKRVLLKSRAVR